MAASLTKEKARQEAGRVANLRPYFFSAFIFARSAFTGNPRLV
jgi:hypothetical protein